MSKLTVKSLLKLGNMLTSEERNELAIEYAKIVYHAQLHYIIHPDNPTNERKIVVYRNIKSYIDLVKRIIDTEEFYVVKDDYCLFHPFYWTYQWIKKKRFTEMFPKIINNHKRFLCDYTSRKNEMWITPDVLHRMYGPDNYKDLLTDLYRFRYSHEVEIFNGYGEQIELEDFCSKN